MTLNLNVPNAGPELKPRIVVVGVGGAGCNAVNNMIDLDLDGVEFVVTNTDAQSLAQNRAERRIQLGANITHGLGAGARPDIGRAAAEEAMDSIIDQLQGGHMAFVTAGMGGGTGTGAAPVIARAARELGILTVGVVTKPFHFEGGSRMEKADEGLEELQQYVDTLIVIPNQNLFRICNEKTTFSDAFRLADNVLYSGVRGVTDLMVMPGLINLDFADIRTVMSEMGKAMMGTGEASGEKRAIDAAEAAIANPLLDDVSMKGAKGVLINITGGADMTLFEVDEAANRIRDEVDAKANIIFGSTFDQNLEDVIRVSIVATGIDVNAAATARPAASVSLLNASPRREPERIPTSTAAISAPVTAASAPIAEPLRTAVGYDVATAPHIPPVAATPYQPSQAEQPAQMRGPGVAQPFIAPRPVETAAGGMSPERAQDPFTTRVLRPTEPEPRKKKGLGFFQRVTEKVAGTDKESETEIAPTGLGQSIAEPQIGVPAPAPRVEAQTQNVAPAPFEAPSSAPVSTGTATGSDPAQVSQEISPSTSANQTVIPTEPTTEPAKNAAFPVPLLNSEEIPAAPQLPDETAQAAPPPIPEPTPEAIPETPPASPEQPTLEYGEPAPQTKVNPSEEDLLEIPAFLRRQAN